MPDDRIMAGDEDNLRHVFRQELQQWLRSMPAEDADEVSRALAGRLYSSIVAPVIHRDRDENSLRILASGAEITADANGVSVGTLGKSEFDIMNFNNVTASIESAAEGRRVNITSRGGGADCMFDYLVSTCWATEVAAGRGTEGQVMTSLTGCTFVVYSTVQAAVTAADAADAVKIIYVCPGRYNESITLGATFGSTHDLMIWSSGSRGADIGPTSAASDAITIASGDPTFWFNGLYLRGGIGGHSVVASGSSVAANFVNCEFARSVTGDFGGAYFNQCKFTSGYQVESGYTPSAVFFDQCIISGALTWADTVTDHYFSNCNFGAAADALTVTKQLINVHFTNCTWATGGSTKTSVTINATATLADLSFVNCEFATPSTVNGAIYFQATTGMSAVRIVGNYFNRALASTNPYITSADTDTEGVVIVGNTFPQDGSGNYVEDSGGVSVSGNFKNSVFGPNSPGWKADYSITGSGNTFNGAMVGAGAPTHNSFEGAQYFDSTANTLYINTDGSTTWAVYGTAGGGGSAPSPHAFVGPDHSGDDDYTLTPKVLGLGVGTGGADWYSDAGITGTAHIDGPIGHAVFGTGDPGKSISIDSVSQDAQLAVRMVLSQGAGLLFTGHGTLTSSVPWMNIARSRGTYAVPISVTTSDDLGGQRFYGYDGATYQIAAQILAEVDAATGAGDMPGRLVFSTTPDGAKAVVERMRITREGAITVVSIAAPATPASDSISIYGETGTDFLKAKDDNAAVYNLTHKHTVPCIVDGTVTNQKTVIGPMAQAGVVTASKAKTCDAVTIGATAWIGQAYLIPAANVDTDGGTTSIYTTAPSITNGHMVSTNDALTTTPLPFAAGDYFAFGTTQVGTSATMIEFGLTIRYT